MTNASTTTRNDRSTQRLDTEVFVEHFLSNATSEAPKHIRLRNAILEAIRDGSLGPGDQIPSETELKSALNISLGTVQRTLSRLAQEGTLIREHGRGTFVANAMRPVDGLWQLRFRARDGKEILPVYSKVVDQRVLHEEGAWSEALGPDPKGYLRVARMLKVDEEFDCYSHFVVRMSRFAGLRESLEKHPVSVNLKRILAEQFNAPTLSVSRRFRATPFASDICEILSLNRGTSGMLFEVIGYGYGSEPILFHRIWVPPTDFFLDVNENDDTDRNGGGG